MREFHGTATTRLRASADDVFDHITDLERLPDWNRAIRRVVEKPSALLPGAEWVVVMRPAGMPGWKSRSHVEEMEPGILFAYRSHTDDTNPSYARWRWDITRGAEDVAVTVTWSGYPKTIGRRLIAAPLRRRMLEREVAASLNTIRMELERR